MRSQRFVISALIAASLVAIAGSAQAVVYEISVKNRVFCCDSVFIAGTPLANGGFDTVVATASQTGAAPQPIKIGTGHAAHHYSMFFFPSVPFNTATGPPNIGTASFRNGPGTLQKGGGNAASFSFCPKHVGLPTPGACTHPANATPVSQGFNGRAKVTPGKNHFGGTLQILSGPGGVGGSQFYVRRFLAGPNMSQSPAAIIHGGFNFAPIGAMTPGYAVTVPQPGMVGFKVTGFMTQSYPDQALFHAGAGPFTTGMVTLRITMQAGLPVRSVMLAGYDNRTPGGLGNIQLVSGLLANGFNGKTPGGTPIGWKMRISVIPEPSAGLSLAAGALGLLLVGLLRQRGARARRLLNSTLVVASLVAAADTAHAVVYEISVKNRNFCCDLVFIAGVPQENKGYHTVVATASQTGGATPRAIKIGMGRAAQFHSTLRTYPSPLANYGTVSFSNGPGTLQKSGGNAVSFSFCPKQVGLPAPGACTHPAQATPVSEGFNGRVKVTPGKNHFGGTLQILAGPGGLGGSKFRVFRLLGGPNMSKSPAAIVHGGFDLAPIGAMTPGYAVTVPQPQMTGYFWNGFMSMSYPDQALWEQGAGPFTTGMVTLRITMQAGLPIRSVMLAGYDNRTPGGLGNIQLVSGLLANGFNGKAIGGTPIGWKMRIRFIPEPSASLGLAAGALALLLVGLLGERGARAGQFLISILIVASLVATAGAAHAVVYEISVKNRTFCCDSVFIAGIPHTKRGYHTVVATASQTGVAAPQPIKIPMGHAAHRYSTFFPAPYSLFFASSGVVSFRNEAGTLQKGGGNAATFSFCPKHIGLPAPGACTHPAKATPTSQGFNGRVKVTPGKNQFGGTLQILAGPGGVGGSQFFLYRFLGGPSLSQSPVAVIHGGFNLAPIGAMTPGHAVTLPVPVMIGFKATGFMSRSYPDQAIFHAGAGPFTTGMVTLQITMQAGLPVRSVMLAGYDNRTPGGLGNIQLVSGLLANGFNGPSPGGTPIGWKMRISFIPEPSASLGLAAGALGLLLVGLLRQRGTRARWLLNSTLVVASLVAIADTAHAVAYEISVKNRTFCCTNPPLLLGGDPSSMSGYHTVTATASVKGTGPPAIRIGMGHAARHFSMRTFMSFPTVDGTWEFSVSNGSGTLQKNGGNPVTFSFCPKHVGLPAPGACTKASKATPDSLSFNHRVKVTPGKNKFGGTLQVLAGPGGIGGTQVYLKRYTGGFSKDRSVFLIRGGRKSSPIGAATPGYVAELPISFTIRRNFGMTTVSYPDGMVWEQGAGPFTTGMVTVQVTMQGGPFPVRSVMLTGYDNRTAGGLGNIQVVSGLLSEVYHSGDLNMLPLGWKMRISVIPEPGASLGLAAGALALLLVGSLRTRLRR